MSDQIRAGGCGADSYRYEAEHLREQLQAATARAEAAEHAKEVLLQLQNAPDRAKSIVESINADKQRIADLSAQLDAAKADNAVLVQELKALASAAGLGRLNVLIVNDAINMSNEAHPGTALLAELAELRHDLSRLLAAITAEETLSIEAAVDIIQDAMHALKTSGHAMDREEELKQQMGEQETIIIGLTTQLDTALEKINQIAKYKDELYALYQKQARLLHPAYIVKKEDPPIC